MRIYLDTSAALKLLVHEPESDGVGRFFASLDDATVIVASWLLATELHSAARRHPVDIASTGVQQVLESVLLVDVLRADLLAAERTTRPLRTLDAVHLATALRLQANGILTYDAELADGARASGLDVLQPN